MKYECLFLFFLLDIEFFPCELERLYVSNCTIDLIYYTTSRYTTHLSKHLAHASTYLSNKGMCKVYFDI